LRAEVRWSSTRAPSEDGCIWAAAGFAAGGDRETHRLLREDAACVGVDPLTGHSASALAPTSTCLDPPTRSLSQVLIGACRGRLAGPPRVVPARRHSAGSHPGQRDSEAAPLGRPANGKAAPAPVWARTDFFPATAPGIRRSSDDGRPTTPLCQRLDPRRRRRSTADSGQSRGAPPSADHHDHPRCRGKGTM
jgi:hypothetical protein